MNATSRIPIRTPDTAPMPFEQAIWHSLRRMNALLALLWLYPFPINPWQQTPSELKCRRRPTTLLKLWAIDVGPVTDRDGIPGAFSLPLRLAAEGIGLPSALAPAPASLARNLDLAHALRSTRAKAVAQPLGFWAWENAHTTITGIDADAGIEGARACLKGLRFGFRIAAVGAGVPLPTIAVLGYADIAATAIYTTAVGTRRLIIRSPVARVIARSSSRSCRPTAQLRNSGPLRPSPSSAASRYAST